MTHSRQTAKTDKAKPPAHNTKSPPTPQIQNTASNISKRSLKVSKNNSNCLDIKWNFID